MTQSERAIQSPVDFGAKLRAARKLCGFTQAQAASAAGVGVRLWNEAEKGKRAQVGFETALRMAQVVGIELRAAERAITHAVALTALSADHHTGQTQRERPHGETSMAVRTDR